MSDVVSTELPSGGPEIRLEDRVVIITGASRGIGRGIAEEMALAGGRVVLVARSEDALADAVAGIDPSGERAAYVVADLDDPAASQRVVDETLAKFGSVDVLVNNAGIHYATPFLETSAEDWRRIIDVNLISVINLTRAVGATMVAQGSGSVINVTSSWARKSLPGFSSYITSKAALEQFTRALANEWARHGVRVNAIAPGYIDTDITKDGMEDPKVLQQMIKAVPQRRIGAVSDVTPLAVYLASSASAYVTGSSFVVDGGMDLL